MPVAYATLSNDSTVASNVTVIVNCFAGFFSNVVPAGWGENGGWGAVGDGGGGGGEAGEGGESGRGGGIVPGPSSGAGVCGVTGGITGGITSARELPWKTLPIEVIV